MRLPATRSTAVASPSPAVTGALAALAAVAALAAGGCATSVPGGGSSSSVSSPSRGPGSSTSVPSPTVSSSSGASPTRGGSAGVLPLAVRVSGGLQGLDDRLTVGPGGAATGTVRDAGVTCTLEPAALASLTAAAAADLAPGAPTTTPPGGDLIVTSVTGPGGVAHGIDGGEVPEVVRLAGALVADVALPPTRRALCR